MTWAGRWAKKVLLGWLATELGVSIVAIALVVAVAPWVVVLLADPARPWLASVAVLAVSLPAAVLLALRALKLSRELFGQARRA
jgi:hypothetical protein